ncbi:hypothetical protein CDL12_28995 [Handroanthus impetiginosus]|uniref:F-box domain-containing protein n=1 Tax=Handroanthus impetiginosus TaxID=429701 RepID=A0A2G9G052_9LAMI|nr:hypothetical protein CDL12_28995 [Handroanthus impetiginosus]
MDPLRKMAVDITIATSAEVVDSIDDLLIQILLRLPLKSLIRCKLVSRHWRSLITSPLFYFLLHPDTHPLGLVYPGRKGSTFGYINLDVKKPFTPPFRELRFPGEPFPFWIQQSCNGLLLCCSSGDYDYRRSRYPIRRCYIYNPTTDSFSKLPRPGVVNDVPRIVLGANLAFDQAKFPHYKVVCVRGSEYGCDLLQIEIYSAESDLWRVSGKPFSDEASFDYGVYWNGSIHWVNYLHKKLLYFNVDKESFGKMPLPARLHGPMGVGYFGESCNRLHIIERNVTKIAFNVYEIKRDYSECFVKYHVDLSIVAAAFPDMTYMDTVINRTCYAFSVFYLIRSEEEDSFLVLQISRKAIRFSLDFNTFEEISDLEDNYVAEPWLVRGTAESCLPRAFEHIKSLVGV